MSLEWVPTLLMMGAQHLWQSALLMGVVMVLLRRGRLSAETRSWVLLAAFVLAAASPLLVLLPGAPAASEAQGIALATVPASATAAAVSPVATDAAAPASRLPAISAMLLPLLALVWLTGTLVHLLRLAQAWQQARRLHRTATLSPALESALRWSLPPGARIALSTTASGPMVVGLWTPRILIPPHLVDALSASALRDLLLHEAAHIHRRDLWVAAAQHAVLALYWWNPLMKRLGIELERAREMACDARAARQSGGGQQYASSLLKAVAGLMPRSAAQGPLAVGMSGQRGGLAERVDGLLAIDTQRVAPARRMAWTTLCVAGLLACAGLSVAATPRPGAPLASTPRDAGGRAAAMYTSAQVERLIAAAAAGDSAEVQQLVTAGVPVDARQRGDGTALIAASRSGQLAMVDQLLALGARADLPSAGDGNPMIVAAGRGHLPVVQRLVAAGADVNQIVPGDETPLINAARSGDLATLAYLVEHGADVNLGVVADLGQWRSPLNQARSADIRSYLQQRGAVAERR
jgi:beta-lactamase regulating signal transducer with metallopeptidase domain